METGLYITFFETGEPYDRELPPVGPLDHVVVRHKQLVAQRRASGEAPAMGGDIARWLEAEIEFQRATGQEPGGPKRTEMRLAARDGVLVRFGVFGDAKERDVVPEAGPFAVVVIGRRGIEADGQVLATRGTSELAAWDLTAAAGVDAGGLRKPDVAFRTPSTAYHPEIASPGPGPRREELVREPPPAPPEEIILPPAPAAVPEPSEPMVFRERERPPQEIYSARSHTPPAEEPPALTAGDLEMIQRIEQQRAEDTLRARVLDEEKRRLGVDESDDSATTWAMRYRPQDDGGVVVPAGPTSREFELGPALWRMRFAIIGVLLLLTGVYGFTVIRSGGTSTVPGQVAIQYVNIAQRFSSQRWDYVTNGVQRAPTAGTSQARGVYYVVRLGVTNKSTEGAQLSPSQFVLVDANGVEHGAESAASDAYQSANNQQSQFVWPQTFPVGRTVTIPVIFDVDPSLPRGSLLKVTDLPNVRVRLD